MNPYVADPATGKSATRDFLIVFLEAYANPGDNKRGQRHKPIYESIFGMTAEAQMPIYDMPERDPLKTYIGRASKTISGHNSSEFMWCVRADIRSAILTLSEQERLALGCHYIQDYADYTTAQILSVSEPIVRNIISRALDKIARKLDENG